MTNGNPSLGRYVQSFFSEHLTAQRDLSPRTVLSYRDAMKLFLAFAARHQAKRVTSLSFEDVGPRTVLAFLDDLEKHRGNSVRTRNARLSTLHTFFEYVAQHEPQVFDLCQRINAIPTKKTRRRRIEYLEYDEVVHILSCIDRTSPIGRRDYLLIRLLFETGMRAQEIADIRISSIRFARPHQVRLLGKGRKERLCPLRAKTVTLIRQHLRERALDGSKDTPLFVSIRGDALTRHGILRVVKRHVLRASETLPSLRARSIGVHTFRHAAAIHLFRAGNELSVIRGWLGHESVTTTDKYVDIDDEMKRKALESCEPLPSSRGPSWKNTPDLIDWLESL